MLGLFAISDAYNTVPSELLLRTIISDVVVDNSVNFALSVFTNRSVGE